MQSIYIYIYISVLYITRGCWPCALTDGNVEIPGHFVDSQNAFDETAFPAPTRRACVVIVVTVWSWWCLLRLYGVMIIWRWVLVIIVVVMVVVVSVKVLFAVGSLRSQSGVVFFSFALF